MTSSYVKNGLSFPAYNAYFIHVHDLHFVYGDGESVTCKHYNTSTNRACVTLIYAV